MKKQKKSFRVIAVLICAVMMMQALAVTASADFVNVSSQGDNDNQWIIIHVKVDGVEVSDAKVTITKHDNNGTSIKTQTIGTGNWTINDSGRSWSFTRSGTGACFGGMDGGSYCTATVTYNNTSTGVKVNGGKAVQMTTSNTSKTDVYWMWNKESKYKTKDAAKYGTFEGEKYWFDYLNVGLVWSFGYVDLVPPYDSRKYKGGCTELTINLQSDAYTITPSAGTGISAVSGGGSYRGTGKSTSLSATLKPGYSFDGWYWGSTKVSSSQNFTYSIGTPVSSRTLTAKGTAINYSLTYQLDGGTPVSTLPTTYTVEQTVTLPDVTKSGYVFDGWTGPGVTTPTKGVKISGQTGNKEYVAHFSAAPKGYTVEHWRQEINGSYVKYDTENLTAKCFDLVTATPKTYTGFTYDSTIQGTLVSQTLQPDTNTTLKLYYKRNQYTIQYTNVMVNGVLGTKTFENVMFGDTTPAFDAGTRPGYKFNRWNPTFLATVNAAAIYEAIWDRQFANAYEWSDAPAGQTLPSDANYYDTENAARAAKDTTFKANDVVYDELYAYTFSGWSAGTLNNDAESDSYRTITYTGSWSKHLIYADVTVKVYKENLEDDNFTPDTPETETGKVGETYNYEGSAPTGFELDADKSVTSVTVTEDGKAVIEVYYKRTRNDVTFIDGCGGKVFEDEKHTVKYGADMPECEIVDGFTIDGATFDGWVIDTTGEDASDDDVITGNVTYRAKWKVDSDVTLVYDFGVTNVFGTAWYLTSFETKANMRVDSFIEKNGENVVLGSANEIKYTPKAVAAKKTVTMKLKNDEGMEIEKVITFICASTMHYEAETFAVHTSTEDGLWKVTGTDAGLIKTHSASQPVPYGYNEDYSGKDNQDTLSNGRAYVAEMTLTKKGQIISTDSLDFTFTGTGFDIISECGKNTGMLLIGITDSEGEYVGSYMIDTYFSGDANLLSGDDILDYQVPILRKLDLEYGTYTVSVKACVNSSLSGAYKAQGKGSTIKVYIDAFRVYNTMTAEDETAYAESEQNLVYKPIYDFIASSAGAIGQEYGLNSVLYAEFDPESDITNIEDYKNLGPENELYLPKDSYIGFVLDGYEEGQSVMLSAKAIAGTPMLCGIDGIIDANLSSAEMYYDMTESVIYEEAMDAYILIFGNGSEDASLMAVSMLKLPKSVKPAPDSRVFEKFTPGEEAAFTPKTFNVTSTKEVKANQNAVITAKTSKDVNHLVLKDKDGNVIKELAINNKTAVKLGKATQYSFSTTIAVETTGNYYLYAVDSKGNESASVKITITVK